MTELALYVILGFAATLSCAWMLYRRGHKEESDSVFFLLPFDPLGFLFFIFWPIALPVMLVKGLKAKPKPSREKSSPSYNNLVGKTGITGSQLAPSGSIIIDGQAHDAIAQAGLIEEGQAVVVVDQDSLALKVTKA